VPQSTVTRAANQVGGQAQRLRSPFAEFACRFVKQRAALTAGLVIVLLVLVGIFAPLLAPYDPMASDYDNVLVLRLIQRIHRRIGICDTGSWRLGGMGHGTTSMRGFER
jgi:hypothetical protein